MRHSSMRRPTDCDPAFRAAQPIRYTPLASGQHERQRTWPVTGGQAGRVAREAEIEASHHVARGNQDEERLPGRTPLEANERIDRLVLHRAAKSIDSLRRIGEHPTAVEMDDRF